MMRKLSVVGVSLRITVVLMLLGYVASVGAQEAPDEDLARQLASETSRSEAIEKIVNSKPSKVRLLLFWTNQPPKHIDEHELFVGLADAFGQLRENAAIPFLIKNITLHRWSDVNTWLKTSEVIEERLPAAKALIQIGQAASDALQARYADPMDFEERLAIIFVVARIAAPNSKTFLHSVVAEANITKYFAEQGLALAEKAR